MVTANRSAVGTTNRWAVVTSNRLAVVTANRWAVVTANRLAVVTANLSAVVTANRWVVVTANLLAVVTANRRAASSSSGLLPEARPVRDRHQNVFSDSRGVALPNPLTSHTPHSNSPECVAPAFREIPLVPAGSNFQKQGL